ncbi:LacI family transcriptional regulator [Rhodococcus sp. 27YEA15]|uniref:LacI family DNA-binding transcriptional regulator n=1 Tax=Rhodococcus sp. 27YEA15 TaxID=3156259 RepID=UPI003C79D259
MSTMADVARVAGVSATTVSHVLNGTRTVAPETAELVRAAVRTTRYRHNLAARALATNSTHTIGLAMSVVTNPGFAELVRDIERELRAKGYTLILADTTDDPDVEVEVINDLLDRRVTGLIVNPLEGNPELNNTLTELLELGTPVVFLDRRSQLPADQVYSECVESVKALTLHLAERGHRRIVYVQGAMTTMSAHDRLQGFREAVREAHLVADSAMILDGSSDKDVAQQVVSEYFTSVDPAERATGLVVSNNLMTLGVLRALRGVGLRVPEDVAVVCYDDFEWADLASPQISATAQDHSALAEHVVALLLSRIADPAVDPRTVVVPTSFQHRQSCGCAPITSAR